MNTWVTADTHFGHRRMADLRGFGSVEEMDETLVARWNDVVEPADIVWHLGDLSLGPAASVAPLFGRLNGHKHLVRGNHDSKPTLRLPWEAQEDLKVIRHGEHRVVLCHYPLEVWPSAHHGYLHLHGHSHGNLRSKRGRRMDVGVDTHIGSLAPYNLDDLVFALSDEPLDELDHHTLPA